MGQENVIATVIYSALVLAISLFLIPLLSQEGFAIHSVVALPTGGIYNSSQSVALSSTEPTAVIYYTLDGTAPSTSSVKYNGTELLISENTTLKFMGIDPADNHTSDVVTETYVIDTTPPSITALPPGGSYESAQSVTLESSETSASIYYTTDGSNPTVGSAQYDGAEIPISTNMTLKFFAIDAASNPSVIYSEIYEIILPPLTVTSTEPEDDDRRVNVFSAINATFNVPMNESSITSDSFIITSQSDQSQAVGTVTYDPVSNSVSFIPDPSSPLYYGVRYSATLTEQITDNFGRSLERTTWNFTTGGKLTIVLRDVESSSLLPGATFTITPNPFTSTGSLEVQDNGVYDSDDVLFGTNFDGFIVINNVDNSFITYAISESAVPDGYTLIYDPLLETIVDADACFDGACPTESVVTFENILSTSTIANIGFPVNVPPPGLNNTQFELYEDQVKTGRFSGIAGSLALPSFLTIADPHSGSVPYASLVTRETFDGVGPDTIIFPSEAPAGSAAHDLFTNFQIPTYPGISDGVIGPSVIYVIPPVAIPYEDAKDNFILTPVIYHISPGLTISMHQLSYVESQVARFEKVNMTFAVPGNNVGFSFGITDTRPPGTPEPPLDAPALFLDVGFVGDVDFSDPSAFDESPKIDILVNKTLAGFDQLPDGCSDFVMLLFNEGANEWTEIEKLRTPTLDTGADTPNDSTDDKCGFTIEPPHFSKFAVGGVRGQTVSTEDDLPAVEHHGGGHGGAGSTSAQQMVSGNDIETETRMGTDYVTVHFDTVESGSGQLKISTADLNTFQGMFDEIATEGSDRSGVVRLEGSTYYTAGKVFDIDALAVKFGGMVRVTISYDEKLAQSSGGESSIRLLHYNELNQHWEDATISFDLEKNTVTGMMSSLSPVVAAVIDDGTFPSKYFDMNPLSKITVEGQTVHSSIVQIGEELTIPMTIKNVQRVDQQYVFIAQIVDEDGIAQYIGWQTGSLARGQSVVAKIGWTPEIAGNYTIHIFVWDDMKSPSPLSTLAITTTLVE